MVHQGSGGFRGNTPDVFIQVKEMETLVNANPERLARHTGQPIGAALAALLNGTTRAERRAIG